MTEERLFTIAKCRTRKEIKWKHERFSWDKLKNKLSNTTRTKETLKEFLSSSKSIQDEIKDVGGFVGGELKDGLRRKGFVNFRSIVTLDMDNIPATDDIPFICDTVLDFAYCIYSTHKHQSSAPRLRLIVPLSRNVACDEYEAIGRSIASKVGIDYFDDTTFQAERFMYWPSSPSDAEFIFESSAVEEYLNVDNYLKSEYYDWKDLSTWSYSSRVSTDKIKLSAEKQEDPRAKDGLIGCFCRLYTIDEAIEKYLSDVYTKDDSSNNRYTYVHGSTSGGAIVYNETFIYSHHATDPISSKLCNAYDMVRIHRFGNLDVNAKEGTNIKNLPSYKAMNEFLSKEQEVKQALLKENFDAAKEKSKDDFDVIEDEKWMDRLTMSNSLNGELESSINNILLILENDPELKNMARYNTFNDRVEVKKTPWKRSKNFVWKDSDDSALRHYIEVTYAISGRSNIEDAFCIYCEKRSYHPVKEYLESLEWDGIQRAETLLIDYLSAEDTNYVREATLKMLVACVKRIFIPGCKFDQVLVMTGAQGIGKSLLLEKLGGEWYSDTLPDIKTKDAYDALVGVWIMEIGELSSFKKQEREAIKLFISKQRDRYRKAFAKRVQDNPRTCVFVGTTNEDDFLSDPTGARRFWPIECVKSFDERSDELLKTVWFDFTDYERDQVWAEVVHLFKTTNIGNEVMTISQDAIPVMNKAVENNTYKSENIGIIEKYLDILIPEDWYDWKEEDKCDYIQNVMSGDKETPIVGEKRNKITIPEIKSELGKKLSTMNDYILSREIAGFLSGNKDWRKATTMRTRDFGLQKGWWRVN